MVMVRVEKGPGTFFGCCFEASSPTSLLSALSTCELFAPNKVELLDLHALKHLDVPWGSGWREGIHS